MRALLGAMRHTCKNVLGVKTFIRVLIKCKSAASRERTTIRIARGIGCTSIQRLDRVSHCCFPVGKNLLQLIGLVSATLIDAVKFASIAAGEIVEFELLIIAEGKAALLVFFEFFVRKLEVMVPKRNLSGLKIITT